MKGGEKMKPKPQEARAVSSGASQSSESIKVQSSVTMSRFCTKRISSTTPSPPSTISTSESGESENTNSALVSENSKAPDWKWTKTPVSEISPTQLAAIKTLTLLLRRMLRSTERSFRHRWSVEIGLSNVEGMFFFASEPDALGPRNAATLAIAMGQDVSKLRRELEAFLGTTEGAVC